MRAACSSNLRRLASSVSTLWISALLLVAHLLHQRAGGGQHQPVEARGHVVEAAGLARLGLGEALLDRRARACRA